MIAEFAAFLGISVLVISTPRQDTALTIRNTLRDGRKTGVFTALGIVAGQATWTVATGAGLAALLLASEPAFVVLKLAGAAYLVFLAAQMLLGVARSDRSDFPVFGGSPAQRLCPPIASRQGIISALGNPKLAVFFTGFLPQFTPNRQTSFSPFRSLDSSFARSRSPGSRPMPPSSLRPTTSSAVRRSAAPLTVSLGPPSSLSAFVWRVSTASSACVLFASTRRGPRLTIGAEVFATAPIVGCASRFCPGCRMGDYWSIVVGAIRMSHYGRCPAGDHALASVRPFPTGLTLGGV